MDSTLKSILILIKCSLVLAAFAKRSDKPLGRIYGGHEAAPHSHPYIVSLQFKVFWFHWHGCGGSLLSQNWIVTAGHCVKKIPLVSWIFPLDTAVMGIHDLRKYGSYVQSRVIHKKILHPGYNEDFLINDIAMVKTKTPFKLTKQVKPIRLPINYKMTSQLLTLAGWGALTTTSFIPDVPNKLQEAEVTHMPHDDCLRAVKEILLEETSFEDLLDLPQDLPDEKINICSASTSTGVSGCFGDSGGPLVQYTTNDDNGDSSDEVENKDSMYPVLVGITSWIVSPICGKKGMPTVYTRVANYLDFINRFIADDI